MVLTGRFIIQDEFPLLLAETPHLQLMWRRTWNDMWLNVRTLSYRKRAMNWRCAISLRQHLKNCLIYGLALALFRSFQSVQQRCENIIIGYYSKGCSHCFFILTIPHLSVEQHFGRPVLDFFHYEKSPS